MGLETFARDRSARHRRVNKWLCFGGPASDSGLYLKFVTRVYLIEKAGLRWYFLQSQRESIERVAQRPYRSPTASFLISFGCLRWGILRTHNSISWGFDFQHSICEIYCVDALERRAAEFSLTKTRT
jgi:hypothetical protein